MDLARRKNVIMSQPTRIVRFYSDEVDLNYWHHQFEEFKTVNPDIVFLIDSIKTDSHRKFKVGRKQIHDSFSLLKKYYICHFHFR